MATSAATIAHRHGMKRAGRGYIGTCPGCSYRDALSMSEGNDGQLLLYCHVGCTFLEVVDALDEADLPNRRHRTFDHQRSGIPSAKGRAQLIRRLISDSVPAAGSPMRMYLSGRGITLMPPLDLRYLPRHRHAPSKAYFPAMLGIVRDVAGQVIGLHRTFLALGGATKASVNPVKMSLGTIAGGAVRLHGSGADLRSLAISEGIETGLSVAQATGLPVWAALSAGGVERLVLPPSPDTREVLIFGDRDQHGRGQLAAEIAAERFAYQKRKVRIILPPDIDIDFNDMLQAAGQ